MPGETTTSKHFGQNIKVQITSPRTPTAKNESIVFGGLNEFFVTNIPDALKNKEKGLARLFSSFIGASADDFAALANKKNRNIFLNPDYFGKFLRIIESKNSYKNLINSLTDKGIKVDINDIEDNVIKKLLAENILSSNITSENIDKLFEGLSSIDGKDFSGIFADINSSLDELINDISKTLQERSSEDTEGPTMVQNITVDTSYIEKLIDLYKDNTTQLREDLLTNKNDILKEVIENQNLRTEEILHFLKSSASPEIITKLVVESNDIDNINTIISSLKKVKLPEDIMDILSRTEEAFKKLNSLVDENGIIRKVFDNIFLFPKVTKTVINNIYKLLDLFTEISPDEYIQKISEEILLFNELNRLVGENGVITVALNNANSLPILAKTTVTNINNLTKLITTLISVENINVEALKNLGQNILDIFKNVDSALNEIESLDISSKIDKIKELIDKVNDFYVNEVTVVANNISDHSKDIEIIEGGLSDAYEVAISTEYVDESAIERSMSNAGEIIDAISILGLVMLLGGWIIHKHPELIEGSLKFGGTLSQFLLKLMIPIALLMTLSAILKSENDNILRVGLFITMMGLLMMLGAAIGSSDKMILGSARFALALTKFLTMLMIPFALISLLSRNKDAFLNINKINAVVVVSALMMIFGSYIIDSIDIEKALLFGILLSAFILSVTLPFTLYGAFTKTALQISKELNYLILICSGILIFGAIFAADNRFVLGALKFTAVFSLFILGTLAPILIVNKLINTAERTIKEIKNFVITTSIILMIGAFLAADPAFVKNALLYTLVFTLFITAFLVPIFLFLKFLPATSIALSGLTLFLSVSTFIMMTGSIFVRNRELVANALLFGVILSAFISISILPVLAFSIFVKTAIINMAEIGLFILAAAGALALGVFVAKNAGKAIVGALLIAGFALAISYLMKFVNTSIKKPDLEGAEGIFKGIAKLLLVAIAGVLIIKFLDIKPKDLITFALLSAIIMAETAIVLNLTASINERSAKGAAKLIAMISFALLSQIGLILLIRTFDIDLDRDFRILLALNGIILAEVGIIGLIVKGLKENQLKDAALLIGMIQVALWSEILLLKLLNKNSDFINKETTRKLGILSIIILAQTWIISKIASSMTPAEALGAILLIGISTVAIAALIGLTYLISKSKINWKDILKLGLLEILLTSLVGIVFLVSKLGNTKDLLMNIGVVALLSVLLIGLTGAVVILNKAKVEWKHILMVGALAAILLILVGVVAVIGMVGPGVVEAAIVAVAGLILAFTLFVIGIGVALNLIVLAIKKAEEIKNPEIIGDIFYAFINSIASIPLNKLLLAGINAVGIFILTGLVLIPLVLITLLISNISKMKMPTGFDINGKPTGYVKMEKKDFQAAAENIEVIISTLIDAVASASNKIKGTRIQDLLKGIGTILLLSKVIGNISKSISEYAKLNYPLLDNEGKIIGYNKLEYEDFKQAGENIGIVITGLVDAVVAVAPKLSEARFNKIRKTLNQVSKLGNIISGISTSLTAYSKLLIPIEWNENGQPIKFKHMVAEDFENAAKNIGTVITTLIDSILLVTNDPKYKDYFKNPKQLAKILKPITTIGGILTSFAVGLSSMAKLQFVEYDEEGKVINRVTALNVETFKNVATNIALVLETTIKAILSAARSIGDNNLEKIKGVMKGLKPAGDFIANVAQGLVSMADLKFPVYDNQGNVIEYKAITSKTLDDVITNIKSLLTAVINALLSVDVKNLKPGKLRKTFSALSESTDFLSFIADFIIKLSNDKIVIDGLEYTIDSTKIASTKQIIVDMISAPLEAFKIIHTNYKNQLKKRGDESILQIVKNLNTVLEFVSSYIENIDKFSKIDNYDVVIDNMKKLISETSSSILDSIKTNDIKNTIDKFKDYKKLLKANEDIIKKLISYLNTVNKNEEIINSIDSKSIFKNISSIITNLVENNPFKDMEKIEKGRSESRRIKKYISNLKSTLKDIIKLNKLFSVIDSIYLLYFSNPEKSITDKINNIIQGIHNSLFGEDGPIKYTRRDKKNENRLLKSINEEIDTYKDIIGILSEIASYSTEELVESISKMNDRLINVVFGVSKNGNPVNDITSIRDIFNITNTEEFKNINKAKKLNDVLDKFDSIMRRLIKISSHNRGDDLFEKVKGMYKSIYMIKLSMDETPTSRQLQEFSKEVESLEKFVKVIDRVDVSKMAKLNEIMQTLNELAKNMGNLDKLADALGDNFFETISTLADKVEEAKEMIQRIEEIQTERNKALSKNIGKIKEMIETPMTVNVGKLESNNHIKAGFEKNKE